MKKLIALFLAVTTVVTSVICAFPVSAAGEQSVDAGEITAEGTTDFGNMLADDILEYTEGEEESAYEEGYSVTDIVIDGSLATVTYDSLEEANLVVALYTEDGLQMLTSTSGTVDPEETEITLAFEEEMPEYFMAKAYLLDSYDMSPLCPVFDTPIYTKAFQDLLASTVDDYDEDRVLNLDDDKTTNFAVFADETILVDSSSGKNVVTSADNENLVYVIENADSTVTSLKVGDVFTCPGEGDEVIIVKVADISVKGTTVTITGGELEMEDVFSHVKIENESDTTDIVVDTSTADEGVTYEGLVSDERKVRSAPKPEIAGKLFSLEFKLKKEIEEESDHVEANLTLEGSIKLQIDVVLAFYITSEQQYIEFRMDNTTELSVDVNGRISLHSIALGKLNASPIPCVTIGFKPHLDFEVSGEIGGTIKYTSTIWIIYFSETGLKNNSTAPQITPEIYAEVTIFLGIDFKPTAEIAVELVITDLSGKKEEKRIELVSLQITAQVGFEVEFKSTLASPGSDESIHPCEFCLSIEPKFKAELSGELSFLNLDWLSADITVGVFILPVGNMYWSKDNNEFGFGECPYATYKTVINVYDADKNPVAGEKVSISGQDVGMTNQDGTVVFYLPAGKHFATVTTDASTYAKEIVVDGSAQKVAIYLDKELNSSGDGNVIQNTDSKDDYADQTYGTVTFSGTCGKNARWNLYDSGVLVISGTGEMANYISKGAPWYYWRNSIKEVIIKKGITNVGGCAFYYCERLTRIEIPNSVTSIGYFAFYSCESFTSIAIPDSVTNIGDYAFSWCTRLTSMEIPNGVTSIGDGAFYNCSNLTSIEIPEGITSIGDEAFSYCTNLTSIEIPNGVTSIGDGAFYNCTNLTSIELPEGVTSIGDGAFYNCSNLTSIELPEGVTSIGDEAFYSCESLVSINIPEGVTSIGDSAFCYCESFTSIEIPNSVTSIGDSAFFDCSNLTSITILEGVTSIGDYAFCYCKNLTSIEIPEGVTSIGDKTFNCCSSLISIELPASITSIGDEAFSGCSRLVSITLPDGVTSIGESAFSSCSRLQSIKIPASVTSISEGAFYWCTSLQSIEIPASVTSIGERAFSYCSSLISIKISEGVTSIGNSAFECCTSLTSIEIPEGVTSIGEDAFYYCISLTSVTIPEGVTSIGEDVFSDCESLTSIELPDSLTNIGSSAFSWCESLTSIELPEGVTNIGYGAFSGCSSLTSIELPASVTSIGIKAFNYCESLTTVNYGGTRTQWNSISIGSGNSYLTNAIIIFLGGVDVAEGFEYEIVGGEVTITDYTGDSTNLTIPSEIEGYPVTTIDDYAFFWHDELMSIEIPEGVTIIGEYAFENCQKLKSITIPDSLTSIGDEAFSDCTSLTSIEIPEGVTSIGYRVFSDCTSLTSIEIPEGVTSIGNIIVAGCDSLISLTVDVNNDTYYSEGNCIITKEDKTLVAGCNVSVIPEGVTSISDNAFYGCKSLVSITIPESVTSIGNFAFSDCKSLTSMTIHEGVTIIGEYAFENCQKLKSIIIPDSVTSIGNGIVDGCNALASLTVDVNNDTYYSEGNCIIIKEDKTLVTGCKTSVIPEGVTSIGDDAFYGCKSLVSITIPESVTSIGDWAFSLCESLTSIQIPVSVTSIGDWAFSWSSSLTSIIFSGNAPDMGEWIFDCVTATAYYPEGNSTWTADVMQDYGGNITWVSYVPTYSASAASVEQEAPILYTVEPEKIYSTYPAVTTEEYSVSPMSVYPGDNSTEESTGVKTASFEGLVPGGEYVLLVLRDMSAEDTLSADNLLYIAQGTALEDGTLSFIYVPKEDVDISYIIACGAANKNLNDAVITFPEMEAGSEARVVEPVVEYDGEILTEGVDYIILGDVDYSEGGTYTCYIRGIYDYTGVVTCTYTVTSVFTLGDINNDGDINGKDSNMMKQLLAGAIIPTETQLSAADVNKNGTANGVDSNLLKQYLAGAIKNFD